jgi:hypothetical protein
MIRKRRLKKQNAPGVSDPKCSRTTGIENGSIVYGHVRWTEAGIEDRV